MANKIKVDPKSNTIADDISAQLETMSDAELFGLSDFAMMAPNETFYDLADAIEAD